MTQIEIHTDRKKEREVREATEGGGERGGKGGGEEWERGKRGGRGREATPHRGRRRSTWPESGTGGGGAALCGSEKPSDLSSPASS